MPRTYFLTWGTYGTWLHGDERGSVERKTHKFIAPDELLETANRRRMTHNAITLDAAHRGCIRRAIERDCETRGREILALNVRTNHVHLVVRADAEIDRVLHDVKAWATRALRDEGLVARDQPVWASGGNKRVLDSPEGVAGAIDYVLNNQGPELPEV